MAKKYASKNFSLDFHGMEQMIKRFEKIEANIRPTVEKALMKTRDHVTEKLELHTEKPYLPAEGKYSLGDTKKSIKRDAPVLWAGSEARIGVGFELTISRTSIFLMRGSPRHKPSKYLHQDIFGRKTRTEIRNIQEKIFWDDLYELRGK